jgi:hypothetical protein
MLKAFSPSILVTAVLALLAVLIDNASAQGVYQQFSLTGTNEFANVGVIMPYYGRISVGKTACLMTPNCIGLLSGELIQ